MSDVELIIVDDVQLNFDLQAIAAKMGSRKSARVEKLIAKLADEALKVARPVAGAKVSTVSLLSDDESKLDQTVLNSALLREKLEGMETAFPYLATEGRELSQWAKGYSGMEQIFADALEKEALYQARTRLEEIIMERFGFEFVSAMNPGSLRVWPIMEQVPLFELLDPLPERLGIKLLPSFMMEPQHTVSGVLFKTDSQYHNCQLCTKDDCPNRKTPYTGMA